MESQKKAIELCFNSLKRKRQTNELQANAKIQVIFDYIMGLIKG